MNTFDIEKRMVENVDYELVPGEGENWDIRILSGDFVETVLQYQKLTVSEDEEYIRFNFDVLSSPVEDLTSENVGLQEYAACILSSIIENAAKIQAKGTQE